MRPKAPCVRGACRQMHYENDPARLSDVKNFGIRWHDLPRGGIATHTGARCSAVRWLEKSKVPATPVSTCAATTAGALRELRVGAAYGIVVAR